MNSIALTLISCFTFVQVELPFRTVITDPALNINPDEQALLDNDPSMLRELAFISALRLEQGQQLTFSAKATIDGNDAEGLLFDWLVTRSHTGEVQLETTAPSIDYVFQGRDLYSVWCWARDEDGIRDPVGDHRIVYTLPTIVGNITHQTNDNHVTFRIVDPINLDPEHLLAWHWVVLREDGATPVEVSSTDPDGHVEFEFIEQGHYLVVAQIELEPEFEELYFNPDLSLNLHVSLMDELIINQPASISLIPYLFERHSPPINQEIEELTFQNPVQSVLRVPTPGIARTHNVRPVHPLRSQNFGGQGSYVIAFGGDTNGKRQKYSERIIVRTEATIQPISVQSNKRMEPIPLLPGSVFDWVLDRPETFVFSYDGHLDASMFFRSELPFDLSIKGPGASEFRPLAQAVHALTVSLYDGDPAGIYLLNLVPIPGDPP